MALTWLRLDLRRRWRSLVVLALLVALSAGVVLTAVAGARRGDTAFGRLWARTLPATVVVLPNQPGFDWAKVRALPEVSALGLFAVYYGAAVEGMDGVDLGFPPANADALQTVERPVVLAGRMASPGRADEAVVTPHFLTAHHKQVGDILTLRLSTPAQAAAGHRREPDAAGRPAGHGTHRRRDQDPVRARQRGRQRRGDPDVRPAYPVPRRHHGHEHKHQPDLHQRPDPADGRRGRDPGVPRRSRPGDRAVRHRRARREHLDRRPRQEGDRIRGGLPARVRARGAARRAGPRRPVGGQVRLGRGGGTPGAAGGGADPPAGGGVRRARARAGRGSPAPRWAWPPRSSPPAGCRSAPPPSRNRARGSAPTGWCSAPAGPRPCCSCLPRRRPSRGPLCGPGLLPSPAGRRR